MADCLLDDLDDLSDVGEEDGDESPAFEDGVPSGADGGDPDGHAHEGKPSSTGLKPRPRLLDDQGLRSHLKSIRAVCDNGTSSTKEDDDHQHTLILSTNKHLLAISHEIHRTHLDLCRLYNPKFPELEDLITDPYQYRSAIGILQNEMDVTKKNEELNAILSSNQIITISVAGSTTTGRPLTDEEMRQVNETCAYLDQLKLTQTELSTFVESKMESWAPSVCALIGPSLAAQLFASTGGLGELSKIPACNLQLIGKNKSTSASRGGMATNARSQHAGYLMECELVQRCPNYLKMKAMKAVAGKLALAARTDHVNCEAGRARSAAVGRKFHGELKTKFNKWEEPDKAQSVKALPK